MSDNYSFFDMIVNASFVVQVVMALLMVASVTSWTIIIRKRRLLNQALSGSDAFENSFWSGGDLNAIYRDITRGKTEPADMAGLFEAGFREFRRLTAQQNMSPDQVLDGVRRMMHVAQMREMDRLEESLSTLATIGSTSPYVGLFGTVWGIMNSFRGLGNVQSATLAVVAPGIAEALVATAIGLFAAIPAVIAYNRYADKVARLEVRYDSFIEEFFSVLQRHAHSRTQGFPVAAMRKTRKRRLMSDINVVPYIDVMLVLLVIFMVTAPLLTQGIDVELPEAAADPITAAQDHEPLVLSVDAEGRMYLSVGDNEDQPIEPEKVVELASAVLRRNPQTPVLVNADQRVAYREVVAAMVLLKEAGAKNVGFLTEPPTKLRRRG